MTLPNFVAHQRLKASDLQAIRDAIAALGIWQAWPATPTNLTVGSGSLASRYARVGDLVFFRFRFVYGSGSAVGSGPMLSLPVTALDASINSQIGVCDLFDSGTARKMGRLVLSSTTAMEIRQWTSTVAEAAVSATSPHTWAAPDEIAGHGFYEAA